MDKDLKFMLNLPEEQIRLFTDTMIKKGALTEFFSISDEYKYFSPTSPEYIKRMSTEHLSFGSNTFKNLFGTTNSYRVVLLDVAKKLKIKKDPFSTVEKVESQILEKIILGLWDKLDETDRELIFQEIDPSFAIKKLSTNGITAGALLTIFRMGKFESYKLSVILVNAFSKAFFGRGLSLLANATLTRTLSVIVGPIGIVISALWTLYDFSGPAYRVTIPCTILIALFRRIHSYEESLDK